MTVPSALVTTAPTGTDPFCADCHAHPNAERHGSSSESRAACAADTMSARLEELDDVEDGRGVHVVDHVADVDGGHRTLTMINTMDERASQLVSVWLRGLSVDARHTLYSLLDELCGGLDVSRHNPFGFLRLRAEFETSGELFGCTLPDLRDAIAASLDGDVPVSGRPASALESLRGEIASRGHPDFR